MPVTQYFGHVMYVLGPLASCLSPHSRCHRRCCSCLHQGRWEAPGTEVLTVYQWKRVVNMGMQPLSWPWCRTIHHLGLEKGCGWEVYPDGGHLTQVRASMSLSVKSLGMDLPERYAWELEGLVFPYNRMKLSVYECGRYQHASKHSCIRSECIHAMKLNIDY